MFGGVQGEIWNKAFQKYDGYCKKAFQKYDGYCKKMKIPPDLRASYIQLMLRDEAEDFFFTEINNQCGDDYNAIIHLMSNRYNSSPRKRAMLDEVRNLKLKQFVEEEPTDAQALTKLAQKIEKIVQLDQPDNDDRSKHELLRAALMESLWVQCSEKTGAKLVEEECLGRVLRCRKTTQHTTTQVLLREFLVTEFV